MTIATDKKYEGVLHTQRGLCCAVSGLGAKEDMISLRDSVRMPRGARDDRLEYCMR